MNPLHQLRLKNSILTAAAFLLALPTLLLAQEEGSEGQAVQVEWLTVERDFHWADIGQWMVWLWNLRVLRIGEADVRVSQIVFAIAIVTIGIWISRRFTRTVRERLISRTPLDVNAAAALEKIMFYVLLVVIVLTALQTVNIPIAMFAFLGGAIAIGIGFGAQNIFNNFISGLILMLDRPIRLGDTVEVNEHYGRIAEIGARCTRLRRFDGIDVLVPNGALIENAVVNWTLADKQVRQVVRVGIAYGSDVRQAESLITQAVEEHPDVLAFKPPRVIFEDFGDNALIFDVYFWLELSELVNMRTIRSDIRFRIHDLLDQAGIVIAFPQRDVHLDTQRPLDVRVVQPTEATAAT